MPNWFRITAVLALILAVMALLGVVGAGAMIGDWYADDVSAAAHGRPRDGFWLMVFAVVMATALLAAIRKVADQARALARVRRQ